MDMSPDFRHAIEVLIQIHSREVAQVLPPKGTTTSDVFAQPERVSTRILHQASFLDSLHETVQGHNSQKFKTNDQDADQPPTKISHYASSMSYLDSLKETLEEHNSQALETRGQDLEIQVLPVPATGEEDREEKPSPFPQIGMKTKGHHARLEEAGAFSTSLHTKTQIGGQGLAESKNAILGHVREAMGDGAQSDEFQYDVSRFYHRTGVAQAIARSAAFGYVTMFVIMCNAVYIGVESDNTDGADPVLWFQIFDNVFGAYFLFEWCCRFLAVKGKRNCFKDTWFMFDSFLIVSMMIDMYLAPSLRRKIVKTGSGSSSVAQALQSVRLLRLVRMVRILHALPELATLVKAIFVAMRAVCAALFLQLMFIYVWAIALHELLKDDADLFDNWGTLSRCMMTLIANGMLGDNIGEVMRGMSHHALALILFSGFVLLSTITLTNMLIGLLCGVVTDVANAEKEYEALSKLKSHILVALKGLDKDKDGAVTKDEFLTLLNHEHGRVVLDCLSIDVVLFLKLADMLYDRSDTGVLSIEEIMQCLLASQGGRKPTFQDMVSLLGFTRWSVQKDLDVIKNELQLQIATNAQQQGQIICKEPSLAL